MPFVLQNRAGLYLRENCSWTANLDEAYLFITQAQAESEADADDEIREVWLRLRDETPAPASTLRRIEGPPPLLGVPEDAEVLVEVRHEGITPSFYVLAWIKQPDDTDPPTLADWYERERGVTGYTRGIVAHYRIAPETWAQETK